MPNLRTSLILLVLSIGSLAQAQNLDNPFRPYSPDFDTLLLYHLEEGSGGAIFNDDRASFKAVTYGTTWVGGRFGLALQFENDARIDVSRSGRLQSGNLTYEAWVYQTERNGPTFLFDSMFVSGLNVFGRLMGIDAHGRPFAWALQPNATPAEAITPGVMPLDTWVHLAAVFNEDRRTLYLLVNGEIVASDPLETGMVASDRLRVGASLFLPDRGLVGKMDEIRVSSVARAMSPVATEAVSWSRLKALW